MSLSRFTLDERVGARPARSWLAGRWGVLLVVLVAFAVYANTLGHDLVYDDATQIADNSFLTSPRRVGTLFTTSVWEFQATPARPVLSNYYRPLFLLPIAAVVWAVGPHPFALHLLAVTVHAAVCWILLAVARRSLPTAGAALAAALLFAVHPIHTESVAWVSGMTDPLCALFALGAWWFHTTKLGPSPDLGSRTNEVGDELVAAPRRLGFGRDLVAAALFAASLLAKETAAALLIVLVAHDLLARGEHELRARWRAWALYALVVVGYLAARFHALDGLAPQERQGNLTTGALLLNLPPLLFDYLRSAVWPVGLNAFHVFEPVRGVADPRFWLGILVVALGLAIVAVAWRHQAKGALLLLAAFVAFLLPVMAIRSVGDNVFAERYLYLPSISLCLAAGCLFARLARWRRAPALVLLGVTLAAAAAATVARNRIWSDDLTLYRETLVHSPRAHPIRANLGVALLDRDDLAGAVRELEATVREAPGFSRAQTNLGVAYHRQSRYRRAAEAYRAALRFDPKDAQALFNLAHVECELGRPQAGLSLYSEVADLDPTYPGLAFSRAIARREAGDASRAYAELSELARAAPTAAILGELGRAAAATGDVDAARETYAHALKLSPASAELRAAVAEPRDAALFGRFEAARLLAAAARFGEAGELDAATELAGYAAIRDPRSALPYQYLANAAMLRGDAAGAVTALEQAVARDPGNALFRRNLEAARRHAP